MTYDEDATLTAYVLKYFRGFLTHRESRALRIIGAEKKWNVTPSERVKTELAWFRERFGSEDVARDLEVGHDEFERRLRDRLLSEHAAEIFINRCPDCHRIVRTPRAQQCVWCGFDWHWTPDP